MYGKLPKIKGMAKPTLTTKSAIKKARAVELWRETFGHITNICASIGIARSTFYDWLKNDNDFNQAIANAEGELNDEMRDILIKKAAEGDNAALIFYLKKRHPEFLDRPQVIQQFNLKGKMKVNFVQDEN